jgi:hypothetical protein
VDAPAAADSGEQQRAGDDPDQEVRLPADRSRAAGDALDDLGIAAEDAEPLVQRRGEPGDDETE